MGEELNIVTTLAVILIAAGTFTIISKLLKQPLILGYIIAGFIVGPHLGLLPGLTDPHTVSQWSEIGIIFLLFSLGLEFSFKKLIQVGSSALIMAGTKCIGMFLVGLVAGNAIGWTTMESIFLGGLLSMSSTTIIIKAYDEMGLKHKSYAPLIFGSLVVEDLIAVLLMVLLSTLAASNKFAGTEMLWSIVKLVFFVVLWFLVGIYAIPSLLKAVKKYLSDEILLILALGLCFGMVVLASLVGFSAALGAFVMGSILSETIEGERINHLIGGIKDLFGAVFFVSVGMMLDPAIVAQYWWIILIITIVAIAGILIFSTAGGLLAGDGLDTSVHAGFSLAQLGEFAFIIASLGCSLGVIRDYIYPVVISVSVITTFTTPYMIKAADPVSSWLYRILPARFVEAVDAKAGEKITNGAAEQSEWKTFLSRYFLRVGLYAVVCIAIIIGMDKFFVPFVENHFGHWTPTLRHFLCFGVEMLLLIPVLYGMNSSSKGLRENIGRLLGAKPINRWPLMSLLALRVMIVVGFLMVPATRFFTLKFWAVALLVILALLAVIYMSRRSVNKMGIIEKRFFTNLNEKEEQAKKARPVFSSVKNTMAGFDVHMDTLVVSQESEFIGKQLRELPFRHSSGANVLLITRGSRKIIIPSGNETIYPHDQLLAVGSSEQIDAFRQLMMGTQNPVDVSAQDSKFVVKKVQIGADSLYAGKSLRDLSLRSFGCMVISVLRDNHFVTNPRPDFVFHSGDILWLAGIEEGVEKCLP